MDVKEIREMRSKLEQDIRHLILDFESRTTCFVDSIFIESDREDIDVEISATIKP
jgi:hypothetical protein